MECAHFVVAPKMTLFILRLRISAFALIVCKKQKAKSLKDTPKFKNRKVIHLSEKR